MIVFCKVTSISIYLIDAGVALERRTYAQGPTIIIYEVTLQAVRARKRSTGRRVASHFNDCIVLFEFVVVGPLCAWATYLTNYQVRVFRY